MSKMSIFTQAVHAGERGLRPDFTPVSTPIYSSVSFTYDRLEDMDAIFANERPGFVYTRYGNPTTAALEEAIATLEGGEQAVAYATGMAAVHAALLGCGLQAGDRVVAARDLYGATYSLLARFFSAFDVQVAFVDVTDLSQVESALAMPRVRALLAETMSNPLLKVADLPALADLAHRHGALFLVDNTFATPYLVRPLEHGADLVIHSATKYLSGHADVMGGLVVGSADRCAILREQLKLVGGILGPFEAWLVLRGLKTLPLRVRQHCLNAARVADWLAGHPRVRRVIYPGRPDHPGHALARRLWREGAFGGIVSFELAEADRAAVFGFLRALRLCLPATSLGDVYSLVLYPAMSSHRSLTPEERAAIGISDALVRLSVGIEDADDIIADLDQALQARLNST